MLFIRAAPPPGALAAARSIKNFGSLSGERGKLRWLATSDLGSAHATLTEPRAEWSGPPVPHGCKAYGRTQTEESSAPVSVCRIERKAVLTVCGNKKFVWSH